MQPAPLQVGIAGLVFLVGSLGSVLAVGAPAEAPHADLPWSTPNFIRGCKAYVAMMEDEPVIPINFDTTFGAGLCYGIVEATATAMPSGLACVPANVTNTARVATLLAFFERYQDAMTLDRSSPTALVIQGLVASYPCGSAVK
ncbi:hypothetical protein GCM10019059_43360 [Camelimonas fluminis]|uniref:Rap1a immunity protein domain-containing protein n=1 Tax=Camelimonas fluminis TaxID=1576911 RepID=A0ABV7UMU2_9HYPH|nr:hypothetical protein [Camelimonas fluminis]GHE80459.1 hypothetical protein GCM10019059_43360 [Camelimonas fluminis]